MVSGFGGGGAVASGAWIVGTPQLRFARTRFVEATFVDVGQGAATLVRFPSGDALLVDAGGAAGSRFDMGRRVVEPAIWGAGVRRLTHLVARMPTRTTLESGHHRVDFRPREIWKARPCLPTAVAQAAPRAARAGPPGGPCSAATASASATPRSWSGTRSRRSGSARRVRNDDSVVVDVRVGEVSLLLPGDAESSAEAEVARLVGPAGVRVMLAPHHGSATSSTWRCCVRPPRTWS